MESFFFVKEPVIISLDVSSSKPMLTIAVHLSIGTGRYSFSKETLGNNTISFDVASAFEAEFLKQASVSPDNMSYTPLNGTYNVIATFLENGEIVSNPISNGSIGPVYLGGMSEALRWQGVTLNDYNHFSLKPSNEVIGTNDVYIRPNTDSSEILEQVPPEVYVEDDQSRRTFAFINSFGLLESASGKMLDNKNYDVDSTLYNIVGDIAYNSQPRIRSKKSGGYAEWNMSSGFNTKEWIEWWATEFIMSDQHWMLVGGKWLPVVISINDTITVYDKSKSQLTAVNFKVKAAVCGKISD